MGLIPTRPQNPFCRDVYFNEQESCEKEYSLSQDGEQMSTQISQPNPFEAQYYQNVYYNNAQYYN